MRYSVDNCVVFKVFMFLAGTVLWNTAHLAQANSRDYYYYTFSLSKDVPNNGASISTVFGGVPGEKQLGCLLAHNDPKKPTYSVSTTPIKKDNEWVYKIDVRLSDDAEKCDARDYSKVVKTEYVPVFQPNYHFVWEDDSLGHHIWLKLDIISEEN